VLKVAREDNPWPLFFVPVCHLPFSNQFGIRLLAGTKCAKNRNLQKKRKNDRCLARARRFQETRKVPAAV
jgi:hypothetical protein